LLTRAGVPLLEVDAAQDWEGIRRVTREVAAALGEGKRGEALLMQMDATLLEAESLRMPQPVRTIGWGGAAEDVPGADTLFNTILVTAGGMNIAARPVGRSGFDLEQVLRAQPQVLLRGTTQAGGVALRTGVADHPALRALPALAVIEYPEGVYACGVPRAAELALELAQRLRAVSGDRP
jgi:iron complex transport system substrate-binding protein